MRIYLITDSTGFPNGTAAANRIKMIARAFIEGGHKFNLLINSHIHNSLNNKYQGEIDGISFCYLGKTTNFNQSKLRLVLILLKGYVSLLLKIMKMNHKNDIVYVYSQGGLLNAYTVFLCKLFRIKIIQEINEWYYKELDRHIEAFIMEHISLRFSHGVIAISTVIEDQVKKINPRLHTLVIPVLGDQECLNSHPKDFPGMKYCFWMGLVDGYINDLIFIIKAMALAYKDGSFYSLYISGNYTQASLDLIKLECSQNSYPFEMIKLLGFLNDSDLDYYCKNAHFYIVPLWNDVRSSARFPTKIASYFFYGNPVITSKVGDVGRLLVNEDNVLFYTVNDEVDLFNKIKQLGDDQLYRRLSQNSVDFAKKNFQYNNYTDKLSDFIQNL